MSMRFLAKKRANLYIFQENNPLDCANDRLIYFTYAKGMFFHDQLMKQKDDHEMTIVQAIANSQILGNFVLL